MPRAGSPEVRRVGTYREVLARGLLGSGLVVLALASLPGTARPQEAPSRPPPAYSVALAYHEAGGHLLLFGGYLAGAYHGETWTWDDRGWSVRDVMGPSARNAPAMAYDAARERVVLFGGDTRATGPFGDTWLWDGESWTRASASGPPARTVHALVYDAGRERTVLFGGVSGDRMLGDTWEWDGEGWTLVSEQGPSARALHGLAYDGARGRIVLFGGTSELSATASPHGDTWEWDGDIWTRVAVEGPSARDHVAMGYDYAREVVVLHGGGQGDETRQTWTWDGARWTLASTDGPSRRFARLAWDPHAERLLLYGGFDQGPSNELWSWNGKRWERVEPPV